MARWRWSPAGVSRDSQGPYQKNFKINVFRNGISGILRLGQRVIISQFFAAYKLLCYHRWNLFVWVSHIARPSGRNWVGLYEGAFDAAAIAVFSTCTVHVNFFHSLPSRVGCSFQGKLFSIFKLLASFLLDIIFLLALPSRTVYSLLLHLDPREKISSPIHWDLFCSRKPLIIQAQLVFSVDCTGELIIRFRKYSPTLPNSECELLDSTFIT